MLAIVLEGGSVADVVTDDPKMFNQPFMVIDYDTQDAALNDSHLALVPQSGKKRDELAYVWEGRTDNAEIGLRGVRRLSAQDIERLARKRS